MALGRYADVSPDRAVLEAVWPAVCAVLRGYAAGTRHVSIAVDVDGLLQASNDQSPLTWMDAKCEETVTTPRRGKPVEVQALWIQALAVGRALADLLGRSGDAADFDRARVRAIASFQRRFWYDEGGYLFDVVDGPDGDDSSFRPNRVRVEARSFCDGLEKHLTSEGCPGHLSEIFDGDAPHTPRGCFAQAWSLGEVLLALRRLISVEGAPR